MTKDTAPAGQAPRADWEVVEKEYRANILSLRDIAKRHGVSEAAVRKHAKAKGWSRDLQSKIAARAQDLVQKQAVIDAQALDYQSPRRTLADVREHEIIEVAARNVAVVTGRHRVEADRLMLMVSGMLNELHTHGEDGKATLESARKALAGKKDGIDAGTFRRLQSALSLANRADLLKKLSETLRTAFALEREAYGLAAVPLGPDGNPKTGDGSDYRDQPIEVHVGVVDASRPETDFVEESEE